jgi:hypothetical protein
MKKLLFNPFEDYSERQLLIAGSVFAVAGSLLGMAFNGRFDGMLDLHFIPNAGYEPFIDNAIAVFSSTLVLYLLAKSINNKTRFVDIVTTSLIARVPIYILTFFNINGFMNSITERLMQSATPEDIDAIPATDLIVLLLFSFIGLLFIVWFFILLWNGFRTASNAKGTRHIAFFVIAIVIGEVVSKLIFTLT